MLIISAKTVTWVILIPNIEADTRYKKDMVLVRLTLGTVLILLILLDGMLLSSGCLGVDTGNLKTQALDAISPIVVLKGSAQYERQYPSTTTAIPTQKPIAVPTVPPVPTSSIKAKQVDIYAQGERWQNQWYHSVSYRKPNPLSDASPKKPIDVGIVVYDHKFLNSYTWWSDVNGQYYKELPRPGYKFLFVWVHEELFGDPKTNIPLIAGLDERCFVVQYKDTFYYNDTTYNPVNHILEYDTKPDYYRISRTSAFAYTRKFIGTNYKYGGWIAEHQMDLYIGQGNSWDGYIIYQVPTPATDSDTILVGNFGSYGNAFWRFDIYAGN